MNRPQLASIALQEQSCFINIKNVTEVNFFLYFNKNIIKIIKFHFKLKKYCSYNILKNKVTYRRTWFFTNFYFHAWTPIRL